MFPTVSSFDWVLVQRAVEFTNQSAWHATIVYYAAEVLIYVFGIILYLLWLRPQPVSKHHGNKKAVIMAIMTVTIALAIKSLIGFIIGRDRPFDTHTDLLTLPLRAEGSSFPSGHALVAFSIAASLVYSKVKPLGWILIVCASIVALGRVFAGVHYPTDVLAGALIGIVSAYFMHREANGLKQYLPNR